GLVRALDTAGLPVAVFSDVSSHVVREYVDSRSLPVRRGAQGRGDDPSLLLPHPDALLRSLHQPGSPTPRGLVIGSQPAELEAARQLSLLFIGYAASPQAEQALERAGARHVFRDLARLTDIVRTRTPH
ncbi:HAD family hydrolase, partial [Streptomyces sp. NPDC059524]|uniref:HAD family hydrolase n=1 Tax=Streptomyces sp. NPDC059524 TaxID=3346856 RepID=UPI0036B39532